MKHALEIAIFYLSSQPSIKKYLNIYLALKTQESSKREENYFCSIFSGSWIFAAPMEFIKK